MRVVILYGGAEDNSLTLPLCRLLERLGGVAYWGGGCASGCGGQPLERCAFLLWETESLLCCDIPGTVLICKQGAATPPGLCAHTFLAILEDATLPALSALGERVAVVELRHAFTRPDGTVLEPGEYTVLLDVPLEGHALLACCAAELLLGP